MYFRSLAQISYEYNPYSHNTGRHGIAKPRVQILFGIFYLWSHGNHVLCVSEVWYAHREDLEAAMRATVERDVKLLQTAWELSWSQVKIQKKLAEGGGGAV